MRRGQIISIAILLHRPRMLPVRKCSDIYKEYYKTEGIDATFIQSYELNDSVSVDVTILAATDSARWDSLLQDFSIPELVIASMQQHHKPVFSRLTPKGQYNQPPDSIIANNEFILFYPQVKTIYIFHLKDEVQLDAIYRYKYKQQKNKSSKFVENEKENNHGGMSRHTRTAGRELPERTIAEPSGNNCRD